MTKGGSPPAGIPQIHSSAFSHLLSVHPIIPSLIPQIESVCRQSRICHGASHRVNTLFSFPPSFQWRFTFRRQSGHGLPSEMTQITKISHPVGRMLTMQQHTHSRQKPECGILPPLLHSQFALIAKQSICIPPPKSPIWKESKKNREGETDRRVGQLFRFCLPAPYVRHAFYHTYIYIIGG